MYILEKELKMELSRQEKMKLYEDIGYLENEKEVAFPREVSTIKLSYFILDNSHDKEVS